MLVRFNHYNQSMAMRHNKDILWKGVLEWVFDDLLRFISPDVVTS